MTDSSTRALTGSVGLLAATGAFTLLLASCSSVEMRFGPSDETTMTFELQIPPGSTGSVTRAERGFNITAEDDQGNTLLIDDGGEGMVLENLQVRRSPLEACPRGDDALDGDIEQCALLRLRPVVLPTDVAIRDGQQTFFAVPVEDGTYDRLELDLLAPSLADNPQFFDDNPRWTGLAGMSVEVRGEFNGDPFTFRHDVEGEIRLDFQEPLVLEQTDDALIILRIDMISWFRDAEGNFLDPRTAVSGDDDAVDANVELVRENILESFSPDWVPAG